MARLGLCPYEPTFQEHIHLMARAQFRSFTPSHLDPNLFAKAFEDASREMEKDVKGAFIDARKSVV